MERLWGEYTKWEYLELDSRSIVSFSDAHSAQWQVQELIVFQGKACYTGLVEALKNQRIEYTVELFPAEGKYHHSEHRKCDVRRSPSEVLESGGLCPVCDRKLTLGVMQQVEELAPRNVESVSESNGIIRSASGRPPFRSFVSLPQILSQALGRGIQIKAVGTMYNKLTEDAGTS